MRNNNRNEGSEAGRIVDKWRQEKANCLNLLEQAFAILQDRVSINMPTGNGDSCNVILKKNSEKQMELKIVNPTVHRCYTRAEISIDPQGSIRAIEYSCADLRNLDQSIDVESLFMSPIFVQHLGSALAQRSNGSHHNSNGSAR